MFSTTVIATVARPTLSRAVKSVLSQSFKADDFEVIVVNDSGKRLPEEDWQDDERVQVVNTYRRERIVARNTGAALSRGKYLHFLDDDDWLMPGAMNTMYQLANGSNAHWFYGSSQLVDRQGCPLIRLRHEMNGNCFVQVMAGEWIPLQSSFIDSKAFFTIGGFTHNLLATQDVDLCRRIALNGKLCGTTELVSCIGMGTEGSTTNYQRGPELSRWAREYILNDSKVWSRLWGSACSTEWQGRIPRIYLTSMIWNLRCKKLLPALSRAIYGSAGLLLAGKSLLCLDFWKSLFHSYSSPTFQRGFEEAGFHD